jgi:hypothetical protein
MKATRVVAILLMSIAVAFTAVGGLLDMMRVDSYGHHYAAITRQHAWHDGMFLLLLAIFLVVAF